MRPSHEGEDRVRWCVFTGARPTCLEKDNPEHEVISLSWLVNNDCSILFALADTRGRRATEMTRPEENLQLWKMLAEERGCFDGPYAFANDQARFLFYRDRLSSLHYMPHEDYRCTVTLMSGLPGAGKDTWLSKHRPQLPGVALDAIRENLESTPPTTKAKSSRWHANNAASIFAAGQRLRLQRNEYYPSDAPALD